MVYEFQGKKYMLNLIDTPVWVFRFSIFGTFHVSLILQGHVDFSYEVSRSLKACEGVILLVEAVAGVQAQTMANFWLAYEVKSI